MSAPPPEDKPLPGFREDLQLFPGPTEPDGSPTYNLFDPVKGQFFQISWTDSLVFELLRPGMKAGDLIKAIERRSTIKPTREEIENFFKDAFSNNLLNIKRSSETVLAESKRLKVSWFMWLIYHYLYIRIPLINPDNFLKRTLHYVRPLYSQFAFFIYGTIIFLGIFQLISRFDEYLHTFQYFFNLEGLVFYALGITCVKVIHEFAHAYTAKRYGIYVPAMGAAFIVFWPVLFTDVTDSWRLAKRSERIAISFSGIAAELVIAGFCTLGWALSSPGMLQSIFFVVSSITWISTLAVNLNPALRFDGYYIASDLWGIDNMHARTFAITRWKLREWLLGLDLPPPEEVHSTARLIGIMVFALYVWVYRLVLYTAIAVFIYLHFTKALGIFLFFLEIGIFIVWPICSEIYQLNRLRSAMTWNRRSKITVGVLTAITLWLVLPLPHTESYPAITNPIHNQIVYMPFEALILSVDVKLNEKVMTDDPLVRLYSRNLIRDIDEATTDKEINEREIIIAGQSEADRPIIAEKQATIAAVDAKLLGYRKLLDELIVRALINGTVYEWDESLKSGQSVAKNQVVGKIADLTQLEIVAFVPEMHFEDVREGQAATFRSGKTLDRFSGKITKIQPVRDFALNHPQLASTHGGEIPVVQDPKAENKLIMIESYYMVTLTLDKVHEELRIGQTGWLEARGQWRSYFMTLWRHIHALFWREGTL